MHILTRIIGWFVTIHVITRLMGRSMTGISWSYSLVSLVGLWLVFPGYTNSFNGLVCVWYFLVILTQLMGCSVTGHTHSYNGLICEQEFLGQTHMFNGLVWQIYPDHTHSRYWLVRLVLPSHTHSFNGSTCDCHFLVILTLLMGWCVTGVSWSQSLV